MTSLLFLSLLLPAMAGDRFHDTFGNGKAEITSYRVTQPRYGEPRLGYGTIVLVPEHVHRRTRIKIENYSASAPQDQVPVVKMNRSLHFPTGIYRYDVMTSVFSSLQKEFGEMLFPMKISISALEWCGNFYSQLQPEAGGAKREMHSYFEAEGDKSDFLKAPANGIYEDNLPILIRELAGEWLKAGEKKEFKLLPSLWSSRISHIELKWEDGWVKKEGPSFDKTVMWKWQSAGRTLTYWVTASYPHYIVKWEGSDGEKGERIKTKHLAYWQLNKNRDSGLRRELGLP